jgi:hypothetical protein
MKTLTTRLSGLTFDAATALVLAATVHLPSPLIADAAHSAVVAPAYPHNINPDPNGPYYLNPYDPYQNGMPDHTSAVIGLSPQHTDESQPIHPPKHH